MHICYKIYGYFKFQFFTYHSSSDVHSATLNICPLDHVFTVLNEYPIPLALLRV